MYARYIPPSKGEPKAPRPPTPEPEPQQRSSGADFSYARWIPPPPSTAAPEPSSAPAEATATTTKKPKKKRKHDGEDKEIDDPDHKSKKSKSVREQTDLSMGKESILNQEEDANESKVQEKNKKKSKEDDIRVSFSLRNASNPTGETPAESIGFEVEEGEKDSKKQKKLKDKNTVALADSQTSSMQIDKAVDKVVGSEDTPKKEKRKKEKKRSKSSEDSSGTAQQQQTDSRYASILAKKTKSLGTAYDLTTEDQKKTNGDTRQEEIDSEPPEVHGLEPLPQPPPMDVLETPITYETLPSWLADPIRVAPSKRQAFEALGVDGKTGQRLQAKGFNEAFAVQTAALPLLMSRSRRRQSDVLIAAATGSGKTLAYALPIVNEICQGVVTNLRALVILPTRELIKQAQQVFELCAASFDGPGKKRVRIGIGMGSQQLKHEQETIMEKEDVFDPVAYREINKMPKPASFWDDDLGMASKKSDSEVGEYPDFITRYNSKVDVLICTPGRLVDHIKRTRGFSLDAVKWLVVDEADKLLSQAYQAWLPTVMEEIGNRSLHPYERQLYKLPDVRKIILSATLTRDLDMLSGLKLWRPKLIVLEGESLDGVARAEHALPGLLREVVVRVTDENLKPLFLLELLLSEHMASVSAAGGPESSSSSSSSRSSDSESESDSDADTSPLSKSHPGSKHNSEPVFRSRALIFAKSNEAALRLSRLLELMSPALGALTGTLTSTAPTKQRRQTIQAFTAGKLRVLVASDLVARGIDLPLLDHVVNYDLPASLEGYVHRVGRTARAGRTGTAWTLLPDSESGWFWGKIGKGSGVSRGAGIERLRIGSADGEQPFSEEQVGHYEAALAKLGDEADGLRRRGGR